MIFFNDEWNERDNEEEFKEDVSPRDGEDKQLSKSDRSIYRKISR